MKEINFVIKWKLLATQEKISNILSSEINNLNKELFPAGSVSFSPLNYNHETQIYVKHPNDIDAIRNIFYKLRNILIKRSSLYFSVNINSDIELNDYIDEYMVGTEQSEQSFFPYHYGLKKEQHSK